MPQSVPHRNTFSPSSSQCNDASPCSQPSGCVSDEPFIGIFYDFLVTRIHVPLLPRWDFNSYKPPTPRSQTSPSSHINSAERAQQSFTHASRGFLPPLPFPFIWAATFTLPPSAPSPLVLPVLFVAFAGRHWIKGKARHELCCYCWSCSPSLLTLTIIIPAAGSDVAPVTQETGRTDLTWLL